MIRKLLVATIVASAFLLPATAQAGYTASAPAEGSTTADVKPTFSWAVTACEGTSSCSASPTVLVSKTNVLDADGRLAETFTSANPEAAATSVVATRTFEPGLYYWQISWSAFNGSPGFETLRLETTPVSFRVLDTLSFAKVTPTNFYRTLKKWDYTVEIAGNSAKHRITTTFAIQVRNKRGRLVWVPAGKAVAIKDHFSTTDAAYREKEYLTWAFGNKFKVCKSYNVRFTTVVQAVPSAGNPAPKPKVHAAIGKLVCKRIF